MDDGIVLRASIAYPTDPATGRRAEGRFPVVIEHTPYVKLGQPVVPNTYLTEHGYIYVVARARGTGASGGEVAFFSQRDGLDGKDLVDWAAHRLDGSDGRIALLGCSYPGGLALNTAARLGPDSPVKAIVAACVGLGQLNRESLMNSGLMTTGFWNYTVYGLKFWGDTPAGHRFVDRFRREILAGGDMAYDRTFWRKRTPVDSAAEIQRSGIPVLLWTGWRDIVEVGALRAYTGLQNAYAQRPVSDSMAADQPVTPRYQIIVGDWEHASGLDAGVYLEWLETWLKGVDTGLQNTRAPMHVYEAGSGRWVNLARFPPVADYTTWRLGLAGVLLSAPAAGGGKDTLVWGDPAQPESKLVYTTPPLADGATLAGPISATIYASSSNTNLVLLAHLYDVAPDGSVTRISNGALVGSLRALDKAKSWHDRKGTIIWPWPKLERDDYLRPGRPYRLDVALRPRQWGLSPGHRLRLELTTQSPRDVCPIAGVPPRNEPDPCGLTAPQERSVPGGTYTILYGAKWPSAINLPQLPFNAFPAVADGNTATGWNEHDRYVEPGKFSLPTDWESTVGQ